MGEIGVVTGPGRGYSLDIPSSVLKEEGAF
jgi:hypothetical protein